MNKRLFFIMLLFLGESVHVHAQAISSQMYIDENPYTIAVKAGMLTSKDAKKKSQLLTKVVQKVQSPGPYLLFIGAHYANNDLQKIIALLNKKPELYKLILETPETGLIVVKTYAKLRKVNKAMDLLIKLNEKHKTDQEVAFLLAQFYEKFADNFERLKQTERMKKELEKAIKVVQSYLNKAVKKASNFVFRFLEARLYLKMGDRKRALQSIEETLSMQPRFEMGWFLFAQLKEKQGDIKNAIKGYGNYLELASSKTRNLAGHLLLKAIEAKLLKLIFSQFIKKHPKFSPDKLKTYRNKLINLLNKKKYKEALERLDDSFAEQEHNEHARLFKIQLLGATKKYKQAATLIKQWIIEDPTNSLWFETLHLLFFTGLDSKFVINTLQEIEKIYPKNLLTMLYLADMLARVARNKEAIAYNAKALELTDNKELQTSILFQLGLLYYEEKQFAKMQTILERGYSLGLDYAPLLNLLAYHYTTRGKNIKKAQKLVNAALKQYPDNPHFLDTQALIFYKQQKYDKALALLEKISKQEPNDATIMKHLAKLYKKSGQIERGVSCMERVVKLTYNKKKKKKYKKTVKLWKNEIDDSQKNNLLCCR